MNEIRLLIVKSFGVVLSDEEVVEVVKWYKESNVTSQEELRKKLTKHLYEQYSGRPFKFFEEDTSNLQYLLKLLNEKVKKK